ncbi:hypothetical protein M413DRAFT_191719 [Hebeloma cylindrosporum]|uniref:Uncharacterized protein n=1 Tax=Hebeloma cylindrosporum TaxID=76867 RepID=A0A0C2YEK8_HEBCY|nr:hypothetical protein M413DRAFT_191719 [Hebeloma cylindrosporum h7]
MPATLNASQILQQQQQLRRNNPSPTMPLEQPASRRSRSRTRHGDRHSGERHRRHYHSRSRSRDDSPTRLPRGYRPASPDRHYHDKSRSRGLDHSAARSFSPTQNPPTGIGPQGGYSDPRTQPTIARNLYTTLPEHSNSSNNHRPPFYSDPVNGYLSSRPQYVHRRSRSYDQHMLSRARRNDRLTQQGNGGYSPVPTHQPYQSQVAAYPSSGYPATNVGYGVGAAQPSPASPNVRYPQAQPTTIVPLNDGRDGWLIVPAPGQTASVHPGSRVHRGKGHGHTHRDRHPPSTGSFFSRFLNFGKNPYKGDYVVPQRSKMEQPVQYTNPRPHKSRNRRDSY